MFAENKTIYELKKPENIIECLQDNTYGKAAFNLIEYINTLSENSKYNNYLKVSCIPYLFHNFEAMVLTSGDSGLKFSEVLSNLTEYLRSASVSSMRDVYEGAEEFDIDLKTNENVEIATGEHYGNLFKGFSPEKYFNEAKELLQKRLEVNNIDISNIRQWTILDQGCGGGRYTAAWALLGAKKVIGVDISEIGIKDAIRRASLAKITNLEYKIANVLDLPFNNNEFDVVFSNGVLHHTRDWKKGLYEQVRVLKTKGLGWQYLIEQPGGIFWDIIEILRFVLRNVDKNFAIAVMKGYGIPTNRIFYMLDHVMVPINTRLSPDDLENELLKNGAKDIKRLIRGVNFDRIEYIHKKTPDAIRKFGVGENRFIFTK